MAQNTDGRPSTDTPHATLERQLIHDFVSQAGYDIRDLWGRQDAEARKVLADASRHASERLSEFEARSHYLHRLHGDE